LTRHVYRVVVTLSIFYYFLFCSLFFLSFCHLRCCCPVWPPWENGHLSDGSLSVDGLVVVSQ
jgi:hypothetical protein